MPGRSFPIPFSLFPLFSQCLSTMTPPLSRRSLLQRAALAAMAFGLPLPRCPRRRDPDAERLTDWATRLRSEGLTASASPVGRSAVRVGELAQGTPYLPGTLESYLGTGVLPEAEPLTLSLTRFDCVTLVESCLGVSRVAAREGAPTWEGFGREIERIRYRDGVRAGYLSRLHYFSDWIADGARRGLVQELGQTLGGSVDDRPLRFMTEHRGSYPALTDDATFTAIGAMERRLDAQPRWVIPTIRIPQVVDRIETGDVLAFATSIPGLDVTHAALAYRDPRDGVLRVLHAPLSGGVVEVSRHPLPEYVAAIRRATGVMVARPMWG